ncbi:hypothetical protein, partial [Parapedobacter sp. DT-150]|uniref:hypothetical protein n=1 Tax=Parapedobacter sp. DT-150 TaxID=3396162 RepID=UPI003F1C32F4
NIIMLERFPELSQLSLARFKVDTNLYRFRISRIDKDKRTKKQLFWHLNYGLVKYITEEGEVWRRVNVEGYK